MNCAMMRRVIFTLSALVLGAGLVAGQSLAQVAKKEKERRSKNDESSKRVITDRELTRGYGGLPTTAPRDTVTANATEAGSEDESDEGARNDETRTQEYWQNRIAGVREKVQGLEQKLNTGDWGEGQRVGVDPRGQNNLSDRQQIEQQLAAARAELAAIQDEGRRAGVPAGWLR